MKIFRFVVSLRVWHPSLTIEAISTELGMVCKGSLSLEKDGRHPIYPKSKFPGSLTYWRSEGLSGEDRQIVDVIQEFIHRLRPKSSFLDSLNASGGTLELFVGWFQSKRAGGEVFGHDLLADLGKLHINLALDVYGTSEEPDDLDYASAYENPD